MSKVQNGKLYYQLFQNNVADSKFYKMWYAKAKHIDTVTFDELITHMANHNVGFPRGVVSGVMMSFVDCLLELVAQSKKVQLGDLGTFYLNLTSKPAAKYEEFNAAENIMDCGLRFISSQTENKDNLTRSAFTKAMSFKNFNTLMRESDKMLVDSANKEKNKTV
ncbi:hypothetical protein [Prevotella pectinovora]|uniref:HU family DNA-binding protein n=1 Tax=Prevotella pectinovora TaxID=1602169 RepID=UPI0035207F64